MPVTFNINASRLLARIERAQANVDRRKVERRLEKDRLGIEDPTLRGWWTERRLCGTDPRRWCVAVVGRIGAVGELRDVAVKRADGRVAHCRNYMICGFAELAFPGPNFDDGDRDPSLPRWESSECTLLRSIRDLPADRPDLRIAAFGNLGPGGIER